MMAWPAVCVELILPVQSIRIAIYAAAVMEIQPQLVYVGQRAQLALDSVTHAMVLVHQRCVAVAQEELRVLDRISISAFQVTANAEQQVRAVQVRQIHVMELATVVRVSVVQAAPVKKMRCVVLACVTVVPIRHVKLPRTRAMEPIASADPSNLVLTKM